jgi:hypothetical protein
LATEEYTYLVDLYRFYGFAYFLGAACPGLVLTGLRRFSDRKSTRLSTVFVHNFPVMALPTP